MCQDSDRLRRFEQEAQAAAALNHPNILAVHQFGSFEGAPYLVSELLEGATLRQRLARGPLQARKAIEYGAQIARGLAAAHEKGILHRDLKPENLFVTKDGQVKILDFGLAKLIQARPASDDGGTTIKFETDPGIVMGTVGYMSPEQVRGNAVDYRADVFALGAILYEMPAGKRAFAKPTSTETMTAILNENPPAISQAVPSAPPGLQRVVQRCLEKNPEQRFQSASDLAFALEALSESGGSAAHAAAPVSRSRWPWIAVAVALVSLAALGIAWWRIPRAIPVVESVTQITDDGDGSQRRQLTFPPLKAYAPNISPDGSRVAFHDEEGVVSVIGMDGGQTQKIGGMGGWASWSPDGNSLLFLRDNAAGLLTIADLRIGKMSVVPGTKDKVGSWWVSQDTLLAASVEAGQLKNLMIFDFKTQKWTDLYTGSLAKWAISLDREYLYIATGGTDPEVLRMRFADRQVEKVASLREIHRVDSDESNIDVAPDGSPVFTRDTGYQSVL